MEKVVNVDSKNLVKGGAQEPWWSLLIGGIFIIILGVLIFAWPGISLALMMLCFGVFVLVDGIFDIAVSIKCRKDNKNWWLTLLGGLVGIVVGILVFVGPFIAWLILIYLLAAWLIITGIIRIFIGIRSRKDESMDMPLVLGIVSLCLGIAIFLIPVAMLLTMLWLIAVFAIIIGVIRIVNGIARKTSKATI